ncbi:MAG: glutathione peroxidase [Deltaproteobacteria bacterium]|nr:glutathione peroxidase [Deltaproteobacteria bacterium]
MTQLKYTTPVTTLQGDTTDLTAYEGDVVLVVNTASKCGFTPQYEGLQTLHQQYADKGLSILGFPCNQFGKQEPGADGEIAAFCTKNYGVDFAMHSKVDVNGKAAHPVFTQLKAAAPGLLGSKAIKWNFTKFLVARDGTILRRYAPKDTPASMASDIEAELNKAAPGSNT